MNREEFDRTAEDLGYELDWVTDKQYEDIEFIYTYYPAISEESSMAREQIVSLVGQYGMPIIYDMRHRAELAKEAEEKIRYWRRVFRDLGNGNRLHSMEDQETESDLELQEYLKATQDDV